MCTSNMYMTVSSLRKCSYSHLLTHTHTMSNVHILLSVYTSNVFIIRLFSAVYNMINKSIAQSYDSATMKYCGSDNYWPFSMNCALH